MTAIAKYRFLRSVGLLALRLRAGHSSFSGRLSASDVFEKEFIVSLHAVSK